VCVSEFTLYICICVRACLQFSPFPSLPLPSPPLSSPPFLSLPLSEVEYMPSEISMHSCLLALHAIGTAAATTAYARATASSSSSSSRRKKISNSEISSYSQLIQLFIGSGSLGSVVGLLKHPNTDVKKVVIGLLYDITCLDSVYDPSADGEEGHEQYGEDARAVGKFPLLTLTVPHTTFCA